MNNDEVFDLFGSIDTKYIKEASRPKIKRAVPLWIKATAVAAAIAIVASCLSGSDPFTQPEQVIYTEHYSVSNKNGNYTMNILNDAVFEPQPNNNLGHDINSSHIFFSWVGFDSVSEMKNDILSGNFTEAEFERIGRMKNGSDKIMLPNLSCLYEPTFPSSFTGYLVKWCEDTYSFALISDDEVPDDIATSSMADIYKNIESKVYIDMCQETEYFSTLDQDFNTEGYDIIYNSERGITEYHHTAPNEYLSNNCKIIIYKFSKGGKTMHLREFYTDENNDTPYSITFCGVDNGVFFSGLIKHKKYLIDRPTIEWLSELGIRKYTP